MATVSGSTVLSASTSMTVSATLPLPSLFDQISALEGQDPLMVGATAYADDVFTLRLWGDSQ